jgi:hypothetical protein
LLVEGGLKVRLEGGIGIGGLIEEDSSEDLMGSSLKGTEKKVDGLSNKI